MTSLVHARRVRARLKAGSPAAAPRARARLKAGSPAAAPRARLGALLSRSARARAWATANATSDPERLLQRCALCAGLAGVLLASSTHGYRVLAAVPLGLVVGWRAGLSFDARADRAGMIDARRALPFALDRLSTCLLAGMSVERAIRVIAPRTTGRLGEALSDGLAALDIGMTRAQAYRRIADRAGIEEVRSVTGALIRARDARRARPRRARRARGASACRCRCAAAGPPG